MPLISLSPAVGCVGCGDAAGHLESGRYPPECQTPGHGQWRRAARDPKSARLRSGSAQLAIVIAAPAVGFSISRERAGVLTAGADPNEGFGGRNGRRDADILLRAVA